MRDVEVEEQIQWVFSCIIGRISEYIEGVYNRRSKKQKLCNSEYFLLDLKKEFGGEDNEAIKIAELKKVEQGSKTMKEFVQKFKRAARNSRYKEKYLVEKFKKEMNRVIKES